MRHRLVGGAATQPDGAAAKELQSRSDRRTMLRHKRIAWGEMQPEPDIHPAPRTIVVKRRDGLGGRLLALVRTMRFAEKVDARVAMTWSSMAFGVRDTDATDWHLADLFDLEASALDGVALSETPFETISDGTLLLEGDETQSVRLRFGFDPDELFRDREVVLTNGQKVLRVAGETDQAIAAEMPAVFDRLVPSAPVRAALAAFDAAIAPEPYTALHIRRGDILRNLVSTVRGDLPSDGLSRTLGFFIMRCAPLPLLLASIEAKSPGRRVVVLGDDAPLVEAARRALGPERVIVRHRSPELGPLQTALLDALIMRGAAAIHATSSQFSRLAAEIGTAAYHVVGPEGDPSPWLESFESEVLDAAGTPADDRAPLRMAYRERWQPAADRAGHLKARAELQAARARLAGRRPAASQASAPSRQERARDFAREIAPPHERAT